MAPFNYYLKDKPKEKDEVKLTITDSSGAVLRDLKGPKKPDSIAWFGIAMNPPAPPPPGQGEGGGGGGFFGAPRGPRVQPGLYS